MSSAPPVVPLLSPTEQRALLEGSGIPSFPQHLARAEVDALATAKPSVLQVNVGRLCNQTCRHCHVDAGPHQTTANMDWPTFEACLDAVRLLRFPVVDVTGGAPELNPHFRRFVRAVRELGVGEVIDRSNLTVLLLQGQADLAEFLAEHGVHVVASLPAANEEQTDAQRGDGVFERSIEALRRLNALGYGLPGSPLRLTLVSNPVGAFLPAPEAVAEQRTRRILKDRHGIVFHDLHVLTNMPIQRFLQYLRESGNLDSYLERLSGAFNPATLAGLMCRTTLSVGHDGTLYDCDFNQMLEIPVAGPARTIFALRDLVLEGRPIRVGRHCLGCTAGQGSSCGGALA